jgi:hypothetical protein
LTQGNAPKSATGKEVALGVFHKVSWFDIDNASFIDIPRRNCACFDGFADNLGFQRINLVVIRTHPHCLFFCFAKNAQRILGRSKIERQRKAEMKVLSYAALSAARSASHRSTSADSHPMARTLSLTRCGKEPAFSRV